MDKAVEAGGVIRLLQELFFVKTAAGRRTMNSANFLCSERASGHLLAWNDQVSGGYF